MLHTLMVFLIEFFEKVSFDKNQQMTKIMQNYPVGKELKLKGLTLIFNPESATYILQQMTISNFAAFSKILFHEICLLATILMKYHTLFFSKIKKDIAKFVFCCSHDWRFKG